MAASKSQRWAIMGLAVVVSLVVLVAGGLYFGAKALKGKVEQALGPESEIGEIRLGLTAVEIIKLRIKAPSGWPAPDTLRAERIRIAPDLLGLLSAKVNISSIVIEGGYVSTFRSADGKLRVVPSLLEKKNDKKESGKGPEVSIGAIELKDGVMEFFDATVRKPAHKIRLEQLQAKVTDMQLPDLKVKSKLRLDGVLQIAPDLGRNIAGGDANYLSLLDAADAYVSQNNLDLPPEPAARRFDADPDCVNYPLLQLDLAQAGITAIVWATGFALDYGWLRADTFDAKGTPLHDRGVSRVPGLYFLGLPWLSRRASPFIWGVWHDADYLAGHIAARHQAG